MSDNSFGAYRRGSAFAAQRKADRIDESLVVFTSDGKRVRIKPLLMTRSNTKKSVETDMRKAIKSHLTKEIKKKSYVMFVKELISNKLQRSLAECINKIYPVRITTIRSMYIEEAAKKRVEAAKVEKIKEEVKEEGKPTEQKKETEEKKEESKEKKGKEKQEEVEEEEGKKEEKKEDKKTKPSSKKVDKKDA